MSLYRVDSDDSFDDFLEWRRWKRETGSRKTIGDKQEAVVTAPPPTRAVVAAAAPPPAANKEADALFKAITAPVPKDKGEATTAAAINGFGVDKSAAPAPVAVPAVAVPVPASDKESVEAQAAGEKWVADFNAANDKGKKDLRAKVMASTKEVLARGMYKASDTSAAVEIDVVGAANGRVVFTGEETFTKPSATYNTTAHFVKADAIDTALFLIEKKGVNPLLVISADPKNPGEGLPGTGSLEEQAYRRSTLWTAVDGDGKTGDFQYQLPAKGGIYLPSIQVFRDSEAKNGYQFFKAPRKCSILLAASVAKPEYEFKGKNVVLNEEAKALYVAKLRTILNVGLQKGHDAIVFSAFGCGFNQTPPQAVAAVIRDLITNEFAATYKHITFAIVEDENCGKPHNLNGNLMPFQQEFLMMEQGAKAGCCK